MIEAEFTRFYAVFVGYPPVLSAWVEGQAVTGKVGAKTCK